MKFIVSTGALLKQLQLIDGVVSTNTVLPILEDFLFEIKKGQLTIFSTDLETSMSAMLDVEAKEDGKMAVPAKKLMDMLKNLPEQPITFTIDEKNNTIEIKSDNGKYKLAGENGDDFPRIPVPEDIRDVKMASALLSNAINKTIFAVGTDDMRPAMTGVYVELGSDGIMFVATDAHKLVRYHRADIKSSKSASFIIPRKAMSLLHGALPTDDVEVKISYNSSNAFFSFGHLSLICRLIDARFPDYQAVIPKENPNHLSIRNRDLLESLKRAVIFANKSTYSVSLKMAGSELQINAKDLDYANESNERMVCNYQGEDLEIAFNAQFLIQMLTSIGTDEIQFSFSTSSRAALLSPEVKPENEDVLMLVMPVMLG
jgi:DNA polymerase III subunit beta